MISLLCPTRGRPNQAERLIKSFFNTQKNQNQILFYVADEVKSNSLKRASFIWVVTMFLLVIVIVKSQIDYNQMKENGIKKQDNVGYSKIPLKEINQ